MKYQHKRNRRPSLTRIAPIVAGILALANSPAAFAAPADEPYNLMNQAHQTSTLFTTKSITRHGMGGGKPKVYKGNIYALYAREEDERVMVAKVSLNGSAAVTMPLVTVADTTPKQKGYKAPEDNHGQYIIEVDGSGYIHVCGAMHSSHIVYWRSDRPEDISPFTRKLPDNTLSPGTQPCPIAGSLTFPHFFSARNGQLFWTCQQGDGPLCSYDETTKLWTALGSPLGTHASKTKNSNYISFFYEDNVSRTSTDTNSVKGGITQRIIDVAWDSKNRMHLAMGLLNKNTYGKHLGNATDILYAYSDDGGKTVYKSDGKRIQLPIRAEAGPHQGEVIINESSDHTTNYAWLDAGVHIAVDKADRPMIWCHSHTTGNHCFRLESGRWVDYPAAPFGSSFSTDPSGVVICKHDKSDNRGFTRFWNPDGRNSETLDLPERVRGYDQKYYRDTGELVWTSLSGKSTSATYTIHRTVFDRVSK